MSDPSSDTRPRAELEHEVFLAGVAAGLGEARDLPLDAHLHTVRSPDADAQLEAYCALAVERGIAELAITDHVDFDPTMPAYGFASFADRERDVRDAAARWADRGLAVRFGVEVTYERRYEDEIRGWLRRHPHDYVIGSVHISARSPYKAGHVASFVRGPVRSPRSSRRTSTRSSVRRGRGCSTRSATSTSSSATSSPTSCPPTSPLRPELYEPLLAALVESGTALEVNASGLRQLPRETYPSAAIVARYRELGGRHVTIGSDAHRSGGVLLWPRTGVPSGGRVGIRGVDVSPRRRPGTGVDPGAGDPDGERLTAAVGACANPRRGVVRTRYAPRMIGRAACG